jgi:hypothetical protein
MKTGFRWVLYFWAYIVIVAGIATIMVNATKRFGEKATLIGFGVVSFTVLTGLLFWDGYRYQKLFSKERDER